MQVYWHDDALLHDTGAGIFEQPPSPLIEVPELHPENAERIRNVRAALRNGPIAEHLDERRRWLLEDARARVVEERVVVPVDPHGSALGVHGDE